MNFNRQPKNQPRNAAAPVDESLPHISLVSPVPHLIDNNFPPTEDEIEIIREIIVVAQQERIRIKKFAAQIPRYTNSIHDANYRAAQKLCQDVLNFIHKHKRLLSPLPPLPAEILALIFTFCLPNTEATYSNRRPTWEHLPLDSFRISQVCQRWRAIALDTPHLWAVLGFLTVPAGRYSFMTIGTNAPPKLSLREKDPSGYIRFLEEILLRSKNAGLCLWLYNPAVFGDDSFRDSVLALLAKHASRFATLMIRASPLTVNALCAASDSLRSLSSSVTFPRLWRLLLDLRRHPAVHAINGFARTPALRDVTIQGVHTFHLSLPWFQLRAYSEASSFREISGGYLDVVLPSVKDLERLDIGHFEYDVTPRLPTAIGASQPASFPPKLTDIYLDFPRYTNSNQLRSINTLLTQFHYPAVKILRIESCFYDIMETMLTIVNVRHPHHSMPFSNLTKLYYRSTVYSPSHLISFLRISPNLEELDVQLPDSPNLTTLISTYCSLDPATRNSLVPRLKRLFIHRNVWSNNEETERALIFLRKATEVLSDSSRNPVSQICIIFNGREQSVVSKAAVYLNRRIPSFSGCRRASPARLSKWRKELDDEISLMTRQQSPSCDELRISIMRLRAILVDIETHELTPPQMRELYISELHLSIDRLSRIRSDRLPRDSEHLFRARAKRILDKWEPLHRQNLCSNITLTLWAVKGTQSLVYIPVNDPIRSGPDAMELIYGLDADY